MKIVFLIVALLTSVFTTSECIATPVEIFEFGDFALYVPAKASQVRGIILWLGGPDTRAFVTSGKFGAPFPELEASLQILGKELRSLAADEGIAILGTSRQHMANSSENDEAIFKAIRKATERTGHQELASAPIFLCGISGGTPEAIGFTVRNPQRVGALLLRLTAPLQALNTAEALGIPAYIVLHENDTIADNKAVIDTFYSIRRKGAPWALAVEPGVPHHSLTANDRAITIHWLRAIVELRLGASSLREIQESSGWLGDSFIGISSWSNYRGDRRSASWFPSQATAEEWKTFQQGSVDD
jgi:hypothetical protein